MKYTVALVHRDAVRQAAKCDTIFLPDFRLRPRSPAIHDNLHDSLRFLPTSRGAPSIASQYTLAYNILMSNASRMTSYQRREQLINVGRRLFATQGYEAVSVEEIAAAAKVSKPIVYEHFGGKEGLYAVIVDREMQKLTSTLIGALSAVDSHPRQIVECTALALLTYIEENSEGFNVLVRDSPSTDPAGSFSSLLGDVSMRVEEILTKSFKQHKLPAKGVPYYAQMLVGMTVFTGQYWAANQKKIGKEQLAAHIVNLAWHGLSRLEARPKLRYANTDINRHTEVESDSAGNDALNDPSNDTGNDASNDVTGKHIADTNEADNRKGDIDTDRRNGNDVR